MSPACHQRVASVSPLPSGGRTRVVQEGGKVTGCVDKGWGNENWEMGEAGRTILVYFSMHNGANMFEAQFKLGILRIDNRRYAHF